MTKLSTESITDYALIQPSKHSIFHKFSVMINRLPTWVFIALSLTLMGLALLPLLRVGFGIDKTIQMQFFTVVMLLIAGLMCGLTGMLLLTRRQPDIIAFNFPKPDSSRQRELNRKAAYMHATGLLLFTGLPLANFLACYALWLRNRTIAPELDVHGREVICHQITLYLYLLMCLFMSLLLIGIFGLLLLLAFHLSVTVIGMYQAWNNQVFRYPANIAIINRKLSNETSSD